jgi:hypothetical protein
MQRFVNSIFASLLLTLVPFTGAYPKTPSSYVTAELVGQLGNQLFIIAATVSHALEHGATPIFPDLVEKKEYNIPLNYQKLFRTLPVQLPKSPRFVYKEPYFAYQPLPYRPCMKLCGYFQSEKYFINHKREILELFAPPTEIVSYLTTHYGDILAHPNTVSIHVRFYHEDPHGLAHPFCDYEYFEKAMALFPQDALFIVFSNEMEKCKALLSHTHRSMRFIEGEDHFSDLYLMSFCKHNIIANSSFSWWGAYLNRNSEKRVVAPKNWFNPTYLSDKDDLIPADWVQL